MNKKRILLATLVAFARLSFADLPNSGDGVGGELISPTVIEKLEVEWFATTYTGGSHLLENGDLLFECSVGNCAFSAKGQVSFAVSGSQSHAPGTIELRIPEKAFTNRTGVATGNAAALGVSSADGWATRNDAETGEIVVYNTETKPSAMAYTFEVSYANIYPMDVVDMAASGRFQAKAKVMGDGDDAVTAQSNVVSAFADTNVSLDRVAKYPIQYYQTWQQSWGQKPVDADNYFYVAYAVTAVSRYPSQAYTFMVDDTPLNGGEVLGYSPGMTVEQREGTNPNPLKTFTVGETAAYHVAEHEWRYQYLGSQVFVRYPKSLVADGLVHDFTNRVVATIVGDDDHIPSVATNFTVFTYTSDNVTAPGELFQIVKDGDLKRNGEVDTLLLGNRIEGIRHLLLATANCFESTLAPGADPGRVSSYNQRTNTFELIDDFIRFEDAPDHALSSDDYEIDTLQFCDRSFESTGVRLETNAVGRVSLAGGGSDDYEFGEVKVWGQFGSDEWTLVGTLVRDDARTTGLLWQFVAAVDGASCEYNTEVHIDEKDPALLQESHAVCSYPFSKIFLPDNCTGIRLEAASAGSGIYMGSVYVTYSIKPSEFVKSVVAGKSRIRVWNYDTFVVRDDQGRVIGPYKSFHLYTDPNSLRSAIAAKDGVDFGCNVGHSAGSVEMTPLVIVPTSGMNKSEKRSCRF